MLRHLIIRKWYLALLPALAWWLSEGPVPWRNTSDSPDERERAEVNYDAFSHELETTHYNAQGGIDYTVQAAEQRHFMDDTSWLSQPVIRVMERGTVVWHITADSGRILGAPQQDRAVETLELISNVRVRHYDSGDNRVELTTELLNVDPEQETLRTERPVRLQGNGFTQTAVGMHADMAQETVMFRSRVEGRYHD